MALSVIAGARPENAHARESKASRSLRLQHGVSVPCGGDCETPLAITPHAAWFVPSGRTTAWERDGWKSHLPDCLFHELRRLSLDRKKLLWTCVLDVVPENAFDSAARHRIFVSG